MFSGYPEVYQFEFHDQPHGELRFSHRGEMVSPATKKEDIMSDQV